MDGNAQASATRTAQVQRRLTITDHTLDDVDLQEYCPRHDDSPAATRGPAGGECHGLSQTKAGLGQLYILPVEILTDILLGLDIPSLTVFEQVSHSTASFVNTLPRYSVIRQQCPDVLRAAIGIRADSFSCNTLYETLTNHICSTCTRTGNYLYLITCKRVCYFCFTSHADYIPVSSTKATKSTGLSLKTAKKQLPCIYTIPGRYGVHGRRYASRSFLFDRQAVLKAEAMSRDPAMGPSTVEPPQRGARDNSRRHMSIITVPYLGPSIHSVDRGFYCSSCSDSSTHFRNHYTTKGIIDHIDQHHPGAVMQVIPDRDRARPWIILE